MNKIKSPLSWVGGKSRMVHKLLPLIPEHKTYVEVFGGAGHLLFGKEPSKVEILNDFDSNLMNFWSVVKNAPDQFINSFEYTLVGRETFNQYKQIYKEGKYDDAIHRAHIFYYLVRAGFGSDMRNPIFGTGAGSRNGLKIEKIEESISAAYMRLQTVVIENKSFEDIFRIYDKPDTFFFVDSPYRNTKQYAVGKFTDEQYKLLAECCKNCKGKFLYTINNDDYIRELFKDFNIMEHDVFYSAAKDGRKHYGELIISNY